MKNPWLAAKLVAFAPAWAQQTLPPVVITGNPFRRANELATPSSVLTGTGLVLRRAARSVEPSTACPASRRATSARMPTGR